LLAKFNCGFKIDTKSPSLRNIFNLLLTYHIHHFLPKTAQVLSADTAQLHSRAGRILSHRDVRGFLRLPYPRYPQIKTSPPFISQRITSQSPLTFIIPDNIRFEITILFDHPQSLKLPALPPTISNSTKGLKNTRSSIILANRATEAQAPQQEAPMDQQAGELSEQAPHVWQQKKCLPNRGLQASEARDVDPQNREKSRRYRSERVEIWKGL
jgi:hypothetical protein